MSGAAISINVFDSLLFYQARAIHLSFYCGLVYCQSYCFSFLFLIQTFRENLRLTNVFPMRLLLLYCWLMTISVVFKVILNAINRFNVLLDEMSIYTKYSSKTDALQNIYWRVLRTSKHCQSKYFNIISNFTHAIEWEAIYFI